jgi:hypothetical protein
VFERPQQIISALRGAAVFGYIRAAFGPVSREARLSHEPGPSLGGLSRTGIKIQ